MIFDTDLLGKNQFDILGYYSLALKPITIDISSVSKSQLKKLDGLYKNKYEFCSFLIGQLSRNDNVEKDLINGKEILDFALSTIDYAKQIIGGRIAFLECEAIPGIIGFYKNNGFSTIQTSDKKDDLLQFYKLIS